MIELPVDYQDHTNLLNPEGLNDEANQSLEKLKDLGYEVHYGLTPEFADELAKLALEPSIQEYCIKDRTSRFANRDTAQKWLSKHRAAFLLFKREANEKELVGYGWTGTSANENIRESENTFAIRISEKAQGKGLAAPFATLIIHGSSAVFGIKNIWLETWQSNAGAVHVYHKIGFKDVLTKQSARTRPDNSQVPDVRIYMKFPNEMLS